MLAQRNIKKLLKTDSIYYKIILPYNKDMVLNKNQMIHKFNKYVKHQKILTKTKMIKRIVTKIQLQKRKTKVIHQIKKRWKILSYIQNKKKKRNRNKKMTKINFKIINVTMKIKDFHYLIRILYKTLMMFQIKDLYSLILNKKNSLQKDRNIQIL